MANRAHWFVSGTRRTIIVWLSIFALFGTTEATQAGPFSNFFRKLRNSFAQPEHKSRSHRSTKRNNEAAPKEGSSSADSPAVVAAPPSKQNTRTAKAASATKEEKSDLRYGIPVPGKQGFVTSPFAPESGYIDVHNFPPGTAVKDPFTGKVFLTP